MIIARNRPDQEQPLRGGFWPGKGAVAGCDELLDRSSGQNPLPTLISVPVIARTILYRNPSASTSSQIQSPNRLMAKMEMVRTLLARLGHSVSKQRKSCVPRRTAPARLMAATSSR